jgi:hypothetical protein
MVIAFPFHQVSDYEKETEIMKTMSQDEFVAYIRRSVSVIKLKKINVAPMRCNFITVVYYFYRQSSCFSRGTSSYRGVMRYCFPLCKTELIIIWLALKKKHFIYYASIKEL